MEELFAPVGPFHLVVKGEGEERQFVEQFYGLMKIRSLRETYHIEVDSEVGEDQSLGTRTRYVG